VTLIVACGLQREARIISRSERDVFVVTGGGQSAQLEAGLDDWAEIFPGILLSAGVAGALDPALRTGDIVIHGEAAVVSCLLHALPNAIVGEVTGSDTIVANPNQKTDLARRTGAIAVDMESHVAERLAKRRDLPFGVVRVISDTADRGLPPAALVGMRPDGGVALAAILGSLARRPGQLPDLIQTGRDAGLAFRRLSAAFDAIYAANIDRIELSEFA
jgi:hypothetical protein